MRAAYDFEENNKKYNFEKFFKIEINLPKTCYFQGEKIKGKLKLTPKDFVKKSLLLCPIIGTAILEENYNYKLSELGANTSKEIILFKYPMDIPKFDGAKLIEGMEVPFELLVPKNAYPSCIIDNNSYVRHILTFDFTSIEARKSTLIIIKNGQHFSFFNELYKAPVETSIRTGKHKYAIFYMGEVSATLKLFKNAYPYNEGVPFIIDIDCTTLTIRIQRVIMSIILLVRKNNKSDYKIPSYKNEITIVEKAIPLTADKKNYHIEDIIQMPKNCPNGIYKKLDADKRIYSQKFKDIYLYPSCYDGLISCDYFLRIMLETDTLFSTNEYANIQIDFYEADKNNEAKNDLNNDTNDTNLITPIGSNIKYNKPIGHANTTKNKEINKEENKEENKVNLNSVKSLDNNGNNKINNDNDLEKNDMPDSFEAPPSIFNTDFNDK